MEKILVKGASTQGSVKVYTTVPYWLRLFGEQRDFIGYHIRGEIVVEDDLRYLRPGDVIATTSLYKDFYIHKITPKDGKQVLSVLSLGPSECSTIIWSVDDRVLLKYSTFKEPEP